MGLPHGCPEIFYNLINTQNDPCEIVQKGAKFGLDKLFIINNKNSYPKLNLRENTVEIDGKTYNSNYYRYMGYLFTDLDYMPMMDFVYELIKESTDRYFNNLTP